MNLLSKLFARKRELKEVPAGIAPTHLTQTPVWNEINASIASKEGYKSVAWVYAAVKKRADAVASVPLIVEERTKDGWEAVSDHPLQILLDHPNIDMDKAEMMRLFITHLDLAGNAFLLKSRAGAGNTPQELWPLLPANVKVYPGRDRLIAKYDYQQGAGKVEYMSDDVIHAAYTNPDSLYLGSSPLLAAGKAVDIDNEASGFQKISMQNRGISDGIFTFEGNLTPEQYQQARKAVSEQYSGKNNARTPWVLGGAKYQSMGLTPAELDFMETRKFTMAQVCAVYGVPIEMINGMGDANRASGENVRKTFWLDTIVPLLGEVSSALNLSLVPDYGDKRSLRIRFDLSSVPALQENYTEKVNNAKGLWSMGVPFNMINEKLELGFDEIEGGETGYIPGGVFPAAFDLEEPTEEPTDAGKEAYGEPNQE